MSFDNNRTTGEPDKKSMDLNVDALKDLCANNAEHFARDTSENGQRMYLSFLAMKEELNQMLPLVKQVELKGPEFDYDEFTPGNGYRSYVSVFNSALVYGMHINKKVCLKRDSVLFRKATITKEVEACAQLLASLHTCFKHLQTMMEWSPQGELFATEHPAPHELIHQTEDINQYCFYGRPLGFQFTESIRSALRFISLSMAIFSEAYYNDGSLFSKATNSFMTTTKYVSDPEQRAKRIVNIGKHADVNFCKAFWFLSESELMQYLPSIVASSVAVCKVITIPTEPLSLEVNGNPVDVPIPTSHIGQKPVHVRLISYESREGMVGEGTNPKILPKSRGLIIHCHGGGFVAQSSKSHEVYLRQWAKELRVPILSIDYSLAPLAPYPRALEEILYAYSWALKNCQLLGSTGERIVAAGDSAGANLLTAMTLKCIELGVPKPHGLFLAYVPTLSNFVPSPARLLSKMDPLLPFGFLSRCLRAYIFPDNNEVKKCFVPTALSPDTESFEEISESDLLELQAHKSPSSEMSDTLTYGSLTSQTDETKDISTVQDCTVDLNTSDTSQRFDLLDKFVLDSDTDTDGTRIAVISQEKVPAAAPIVTPQIIESTLHGKVSSFVSKLRGRMTSFVHLRSQSAASVYLDVEKESNLESEYRVVAPKDPFISPLLAADDVLLQMPPVKILTVHMDPCLDDCVTFAKKLKHLGNKVNFTILDGLPHGFLNFSLVCKEAYDASKLCAHQISELLDLDNLPALPSPPPLT